MPTPPFKVRNISCLATGNEIIEGQTQDGNGHYFSKTLFDLGASLYQHVHTSDHTAEIATALRYLLAHSDAVIITGGLGPTSDDNTRFALAEVTDRELIFNDDSWAAILDRFKKYNITPTDANKRQVLFPQGAQLLRNHHGSADACYLKWQDKHIFMLPGPPKECTPIFMEQVLPLLASFSFFEPKFKKQWLTLGLIEGEIAEKVDALVKPQGFETGYRWTYPYLEIKVWGALEDQKSPALDALETLLQPHTVSCEQQDALICLDIALKASNAAPALLDQIQHGALLNDPRIRPIQTPVADYFLIRASQDITQKPDTVCAVTFSCKGYKAGREVFEHQVTVPYRDADIIHFARAYCAWQLSRFLNSAYRK